MATTVVDHDGGGDASSMHLQEVVVVVGHDAKGDVVVVAVAAVAGCGCGREQGSSRRGAERVAGRSDGRLPENRWTSAKNRTDLLALHVGAVDFQHQVVPV